MVLQKGLAQHALRERDVLAECSASRFCTSLTASFQDDTSLYLLMEAVLGGELFERLQSLPAPLGEADARFYAACVVEALDFLHARFYVYRDLKPENLLIGAVRCVAPAGNKGAPHVSSLSCSRLMTRALAGRVPESRGLLVCQAAARGQNVHPVRRLSRPLHPRTRASLTLPRLFFAGAARPRIWRPNRSPAPATTARSTGGRSACCCTK